MWTPRYALGAVAGLLLLLAPVGCDSPGSGAGLSQTLSGQSCAADDDCASFSDICHTAKGRICLPPSSAGGSCAADHDCAKDLSCESGRCERDSQVCTPNFRTTCYSGDVYFEDSCGERGTLSKHCGTGSSCVEKLIGRATCEADAEVCTATSKTACDGQKVVALDSCGNVDAVKQVCGVGQSCSQSTPTAATCIAHCIEKAGARCFGGDVWWVNSCGVTGDRLDYCGSAPCVDSGSFAYCVEVELRCWDTDHKCYKSLEELDVDFKCEVRNLSGADLSLEGLDVSAHYTTDKSKIKEWWNSSWFGSLELPQGQWVSVSETFSLTFDDEVPGQRFEVEGELELAADGDFETFTMTEKADYDLKSVDVDDDWVCFSKPQSWFP